MKRISKRNCVVIGDDGMNVKTAYNKLPSVAKKHVKTMLEQELLTFDKMDLNYIKQEVIWLIEHYQTDLIQSNMISEGKFASKVISECNDWLVYQKNPQ